MEANITHSQRMAWSLADISQVTGLSINFLRYEVRRGNLTVRKFGRRILVKSEDLMDYIDNGSEGSKSDGGTAG
jgi:hypothetical protein